MAKSQEELLQELIDLQKGNAGRLGGGPAVSNPSIPAGTGASVAGVFNGATDAVGKFAKGTFTASDALGTFTGVLGKFPGVGAGLAKITGQMGEGAIQFNNDLNKAGKYGANFGNDLGQFAKGLSGARMTSDEWNQVLRNNSTALNFMGGDVNKASKNFMGLAKDLQENDVARQLKASGMSVDEFTDLLVKQMANRRSFDINDEKSRKEAIQSTLALAAEMDVTARLTGKSRDAMQQDINKQNQKAEMVASTMMMDERQRQQYDRMRGTMAGFGDSTQNLITEIASGGVRTKEGMNALAAMGPAGAQFQAAVRQQMAARTPLEKQEAEAAMNRAKAALTEYQRSQQYLQMVKMDNSEVGMERRKQFTENQGMINAQIGQQRDLAAATGRNVTAAEAEKVARQNAARSQAGVDATGKTPTGAKVGRGLNEFQDASKDITAAMGIGFDKLNQTTGAGVDQLKQLNNKVGGPFTRGTAEQKFAQGEGAVKTGAEALGINVGAPKPVPSNYKGPASREEGSFGAVGKLIEDFGKGTPAVLHGKEGVVTESQLKDIVGSAMQMGASKPSASKPTASIESILGQAKATVSAPTVEAPTGVADVFSKFSSMFSKTSAGPESKINGLAGQMSAIQNSVTANLADVKSATAKTTPIETPEPKVEKEPKAEKETVSATATASLNDVVTALNDLNKQMEQVIFNTSEMADTASKQVRATKSLSNNRMTA